MTVEDENEDEDERCCSWKDLPKILQRIAPLNRSSRRESALTSRQFNWSGLTSAATRFTGSGPIERFQCPVGFRSITARFVPERLSFSPENQTAKHARHSASRHRGKTSKKDSCEALRN